MTNSNVTSDPFDNTNLDVALLHAKVTSGGTGLSGKSEQVFVRLPDGVMIVAPLPSSYYIEKIESLQNIVLARATGLEGLEKGTLSYISDEDMTIRPLAKLREWFNLQQRLSVRPADISQALLDVQPQIVHYSGHGAPDNAGLYIEDKLGNAQLVGADALASLFEQFIDQITCIVLNACYSEAQAKAIAKYIPHVIGMNNVMDDKASIAFTIGFYQALGAGRTIEDAFKLGRIQIQLQGLPDYVTPILISKDHIQD